MTRVRDVMNTTVVSIGPDDTVDEAISRMIRRGISGMPVIDMTGRLVGLLTEFDLLNLVRNPATAENEVYHYLTRDIRTIEEDADLSTAAELFRTLSIRRLPVMHEDQVVEVPSRRDLIGHVVRVRDTCRIPVGPKTERADGDHLNSGTPPIALAPEWNP